MTAKEIYEKIHSCVEGRECFVVDVEVSRDNDVTVTIESENGIVQMDDCVEVDRFFHSVFDQDVEDYSLTVTSAGLDQPFKVLRQYLKAIGSEVEVKLKGGRKLLGTLLSADEESIALKYSALEAVEGKKKKVRVEHEETFPLSEVNAVLPHISFK